MNYECPDKLLIKIVPVFIMYDTDDTVHRVSAVSAYIWILRKSPRKHGLPAAILDKPGSERTGYRIPSDATGFRFRFLHSGIPMKQYNT